MTTALFVCDGAAVPLQWQQRQWDQRMNIDHYSSPRANITLKVQNLSHALQQSLLPRAWDLVRIAAYVYAADQAISRWTPTDVYGKRWRRDLTLCIPVIEVDLWQAAGIRTALEETLSFVSEDHWTFSFSYGHPTDQLFLPNRDNPPLDRQPDLVAAFSGGADSLCATVDLATKGKRPVLVSHQSTPPTNARQVNLNKAIKERLPPWDFPHVGAWVHRVGSNAEENTQRSRSFLYASLAVAVADTMGLEEVVLADNGPVSINLPINDQLVGTLASRSTHPKFLWLFQKLVRLVFEKPDLTVHNPLWDKTRSDCLNLLKLAGVPELLKLAISCGHTRGRPKMQLHCGVCSQCVDRRFAVEAAGLQEYDLPNSYRVNIFTDHLPVGDVRTMVVSYVRFATRIRTLDDDSFFHEFQELYDCILEDNPDSGATGRVLINMLKRHAVAVDRIMQDQVVQYSAELSAGTLPNTSLVHLLPVGPTGVGTLLEKASENDFLPSPDYRSVVFHGETIPLSTMQAEAVRVLNEAFEHGTPEVSAAFVLVQIESKSQRLRDVFKGAGSRAWGRLIITGEGKGTVRINR